MENAEMIFAKIRIRKFLFLPSFRLETTPILYVIYPPFHRVYENRASIYNFASDGEIRSDRTRSLLLTYTLLSWQGD